MVMHSPKEKTPRQIISDQTFVNIETAVQEIEREVANNELGAVGCILTPTQTQLQRTPLTSRIPIFNENGEVITNLNKESAEKKKKALAEKIKKVRIQQQKDEAEELQNKRNEDLKKKQINDQRAAEKKAKQEELIKKRKEEEEIKKQKAQDDRNKRIEERRQRQEYFYKCKEERRLDEEREKERQKEEALEKQFKFQQNLIKKHASFDIYQQAKEEESKYLKERKQQEKGGAIKKVRDERDFQAFNIGFEDIMNEDVETASQISHNFNESIIDGGLSADENYDDELISKIDMLNIDLKKKNSKGNIIDNERTRYEQIKHEKLEQDRLFTKIEEKDKLKYTQYFDTLEREIQMEVGKYMVLNKENWDDIYSNDLKKYIDEAVSEQEIKNLLEKESEEIIESDNFNNKLVNDSTKFNQTNKFINCSEINGKNKDNSLNINLTLKTEIFDCFKDQHKFNNEVVARFSELIDNSSLKFSEIGNKLREISLKFFNLFYNVFKFQNECTNWVKDIMNSNDHNMEIITNETFDAFIKSLHITKFSDKQISDLYNIFSKIFDPFFSRELFNKYFNEFNNISENFREIQENNVVKLSKINESVLKNIPPNDSLSSDTTNIISTKNFISSENDHNKIIGTEIYNPNEIERLIGVGSKEDRGIYNAKALARTAVENFTKTKYPEIFKIFVTINNKTAIAILDSGANASLMTKEGAEYFNVEITDGNETITDFNIVLPNVNIVKNFSCACKNETINKLNNFIYFSANNADIDDKLDDMLIDDVMTNIYYPQVSICNPSLDSDIIIPRGTIIGKIASPLCKVNDANIPLRLNKNLETNDFDFNNALHVEKLNGIKNSMNKNLSKNDSNNLIKINNLNEKATEILSNDSLAEINCLKNIEVLYSVYHEINSEEARYDFSPPEKSECNREDEEDLPSVDFWTRETLNAACNIETENDDEKKEVQNLLFEFKEVFSEGEFFSAATLPELSVELTDEVPIFVPQFKLSPPMETANQEQIDELIRHKLVEPSSS
ncbi:unnamed protein product, partial [Rotaria magnacalcarata]